LQGDYLARQKVRSSATGTQDWLAALGAHSLIHAGAVWMVTGSKLLELAELVLHSVTDASKGRGHFGHLTDQLHLAYAGILWHWFAA
jgi:hypothetical protein